jgi:hypothetical protein
LMPRTTHLDRRRVRKQFHRGRGLGYRCPVR